MFNFRSVKSCAGNDLLPFVLRCTGPTKHKMTATNTWRFFMVHYIVCLHIDCNRSFDFHAHLFISCFKCCWPASTCILNAHIFVEIIFAFALYREVKRIWFTFLIWKCNSGIIGVPYVSKSWIGKKSTQKKQYSIELQTFYRFYAKKNWFIFVEIFIKIWLDYACSWTSHGYKSYEYCICNAHS